MSHRTMPLSKPLQTLQHWLQSGLSYASPPVCLLCARTFNPGHGPTCLCQDCFARGFGRVLRCQQCGLRMGPRLRSFGWTRCRHCRARPDTTQTWIGGDYVPPFDTVIKRLKFGGAEALADALAHALARYADPLHTPDVLIPVPVSRRRLHGRGYNQALLIARGLGRRLRVPVLPHALNKVQDTGQQARLGAIDRMHNLRNAFELTEDVCGMHVGLVDDVLTTGATLKTCADLLRAGGVGHISQWIAMRTPEKPDDPCDSAST